jgi:hypothetical protein
MTTVNFDGSNKDFRGKIKDKRSWRGARAQEQAGLFPCRQRQWTSLGDEAESEIIAYLSEPQERNGGGAS